MDDQLINKRIDRISMKGGPKGSAKPIKKNISTGIIAKERMAAPLSPLHNPQPAIQFRAHTKRKPISKGMVVWTPIFSNGPLP